MKTKPGPVMALCISLMCFSGAAAQEPPKQAQSQPAPTEPQIPAELFVRFGGVAHNNSGNKDLGKWLEIAPREFMAKKGSKLDLTVFYGGLLNFTCMFNAWWKDDVFQEAAFEQYLKRIHLVPEDAEAEWTAAISGVGGRMQMSYNLGAIIVQDRLFDADGFRPAESKKLLARVRSIPYRAKAKWAEVRDLDHWQAAISLARIDSLFRDDVFREEAFTKILEQVPQK